MKRTAVGLLCLLQLVNNVSLAEPLTNQEMTVAHEIVEWIGLCQREGVRDEAIVAIIRTNETFVASNVWVACFDFAFDTNDVSSSINAYGERVDVAVCLRPFCGIDANPILLDAYTRFCDIGSSYSFGTLSETNQSASAKMKSHFLRFMNRGPFFRRNPVPMTNQLSRLHLAR